MVASDERKLNDQLRSLSKEEFDEYCAKLDREGFREKIKEALRQGHENRLKAEAAMKPPYVDTSMFFR